MSDLSNMGEDGIIELFNSGTFLPPVVKGIGDDCAVIGEFNDALLIWTTDILVEDIHFKNDLISPNDLGHKALAVNLSDIAAMGGTPVACLISLSLPKDISESWIREFRDGFLACSARYACQIIGGDTCGSSDKIGLYVTVIGQVEEEQILMRTGAEVDDDIWITGTPGYSALGLDLISNKFSIGNNEFAEVARATHTRPSPQIDIGRKIAASNLATSCMDVSDGLVTDLSRICSINACGATLEEQLLPDLSIEGLNEQEINQYRLHGGEDYYLMITAKPENRQDIDLLGSFTRIGTITGKNELLRFKRKDGSFEELKRSGFSHFSEFSTGDDE